ncbi:MAG: hypothetical protein WC671_01090 [Candidatus Paceibacterota bacterium]|jgi:hypothetical protein
MQIRNKLLFRGDSKVLGYCGKVDKYDVYMYDINRCAGFPCSVSGTPEYTLSIAGEKCFLKKRRRVIMQRFQVFLLATFLIIFCALFIYKVRIVPAPKTTAAIVQKPAIVMTPETTVSDVILGHWRHFGVVGSVYRDKIKPGTMYSLEGGLMVFKTLNGPVWFVDFEPNDDISSLDRRKVYLVRISGDLAKGCGYAMEEFTTAPPQCIMEEKILSWREAKNFLEPKVNPNPKDWAEIEKFLREP